MQIIQIADLHIAPDHNMDSSKSKISKLYEAIKNCLNKNECTVFCILGDIVDKGNPASYEKAVELLNYIKEIFVEYKPKFEFTPGNHDLCDCPYQNHNCSKQDTLIKECTLDHYYNFVKKFDNDYNPNGNLLYREYDDIDIILASSVSHNNCNYGVIDIKALNDISLKKPALLVTHHAFLSGNDSDSASIRNAYKLLDVIEKKDIIGVLHGHTHGYKDITIGEKCKIVGVGPFLREIPNINNQANLVIVNSTGIHDVINFFYKEDTNQYEYKKVFSKKVFTYRGSDINKAYGHIILDVQKYGIIPNMNLNLNMPLTDFFGQIEQIFQKQIYTAKLWQETKEVPEDLYYNHGQYMKNGSITAMEFVIKELNSKATSSKAIIPLINFDDVIKRGERFLPSFDLVQFGFSDEGKQNLLVTLYLRALEVNHFLKINLCEIYLMCKQISEEIRSVITVDITVLAFRAQYKEKFGCFKRAKIDRATEADIVNLLQNDLGTLILWLKEKRDFNETVVESKGLQSFNNALHSQYQRINIKPGILKISNSILEKMMHLDKEQQKTSNYSSTVIIEKELNSQFDELIELLQKGDIYEC